MFLREFITWIKSKFNRKKSTAPVAVEPVKISLISPQGDVLNSVWLDIDQFRSRDLIITNIKKIAFPAIRTTKLFGYDSDGLWGLLASDTQIVERGYLKHYLIPPQQELEQNISCSNCDFFYKIQGEPICMCGSPLTDDPTAASNCPNWEEINHDNRARRDRQTQKRVVEN